jgi:hypothetical protein
MRTWIAVVALTGCNSLFSLDPTHLADADLTDAFERPAMPCDERGVANLDEDGDGIVNGMDNCPGIYNPDQADRDSDDVGDVCDPNPDIAGDAIADTTYFQTGLGCWVPDTIENWSLPATPGEVTTPSTGAATLTLQLAVTDATIEVGLQAPAQQVSVLDALRLSASEQTANFDCRFATGADPVEMYADSGGSSASVQFGAGYHRLHLHVDATGSSCDFDGALATDTEATSGTIDSFALYSDMTSIAFAYVVIYSSP